MSDYVSTMAELPVKSDFPEKPASLKKAISEALRHCQTVRLTKAIKENENLNKAIKDALRPYDKQSSQELVADAVDTAVDTPLQQIDEKQIYLPKQLQFLKHPAYRSPRYPQALLHLRKPENEECYMCVNCKYNFLCRMHFYGKEILYLESVDI